MARKVASTGPTMKTTSSTTASQANAVLSSVVPRSRCVHRARTHAPAEEKPSPTPTAAASVLASGQSCSTLVINTARLTLLINVAVDQHPGLADPVDQPAPGGRRDGAGDGADGGHQSGPAERAGDDGDEQHDAEPGHRQRQPGDEAGRR